MEGLACNSINGVFNRHIAYYDDAIIQKEQYEEKLVHDLERALEQKQLVVYYQPKYNIRGEKPVLSSAEALIRWSHPELGMISPGVFIPLFENNGLICKVDRYVWKEAALQVAEWKKKYHKTIPVSVNVSRVDMLNKELPTEMMEIVNEAGIEPKDFYLEVTESAYTENQADVLIIVEKLRRLGFVIEMDDFGTGYSSLNMLTSLPFDILKLDMVFVRRIHLDEKALRIVVFILEIAEYLKVKVIAEDGVKRCAGNEAFYLKLVPKALEEGKYTELANQIGEKNFEAAFETAHALKGVLANLSITPLYDVICEITELLRNRQDVDYSALLEKMNAVRKGFADLL
ncbi:MAG: EAL domain-containing protein [Lachnospiraceae bacterium]|nr:EAL domain-containing protein [Lachnospiraceae bacterium]